MDGVEEPGEEAVAAAEEKPKRGRAKKVAAGAKAESKPKRTGRRTSKNKVEA